MQFRRLENKLSSPIRFLNKCTFTFNFQVFSQFEAIWDVVSVHLVEVSPKLSQMQKDKLSGKQNDSVIESR